MFDETKKKLTHNAHFPCTFPHSAHTYTNLSSNRARNGEIGKSQLDIKITRDD